MEIVVYRRRTVASLLMVLFALGLGIGAFVLTDLNVSGGKLGATWFYGPAIWAALGLVAWGVTTWRLPYADPLLLPSVLLLNGLGMAMIHRLDLAYDPPTASAALQLTWAAASVVVFVAVVFLLKDHRRLQRYTYVWFALGLLLLLMPLLPGIGFENHGARIWIKIGQFSFQPSEIAKIVLSIAFASYLVEKKDVLARAGARFLGIDFPRARDLGPILVMWVMSLIVLVFQKDLGTTLLFFGLFVMMLYTATERPSWAILGVGMVVVLGVLGYTFFDHVQTRFSSWLNPFADYDKNYQVIQGQFGIAYGGLFGTGWGLGRPRLTPLAKNDFIAAALGEEIGLFGLVAVIVVFFIIVARVFKAALASREPFGKLLAAGLAFVFALQVFTIIGGVTRLLPLTGLTTPFISQGGSSLLANYTLLALMLTITHQVRRPQIEVPDVPPEQVNSTPRPDPAAYGAVPPASLDAPTEQIFVDDGTVRLPRGERP